MLIEQPGFLGSLKLKNRITLAPMGTNFSSSDGLITERDIAYYVERAKGGVSMIMTAAMGVTGDARAHRFTPVCYHDRFIPGLAKLVEAIKSYDCHVFGQLNHHGALLHVPGSHAVGPSDWINPKTGGKVEPMSKSQIIEVQKHFASAAKRLWIAGYDGVEIHAANGYLFQQFFTPRINFRDDEYGGSIENRMRFLLETVSRMQDASPDLKIMVRFSVSEFTKGGYSEEDAIALAQGLEKQGVVAIDLSGGSNETPQMSKYCIQTPSFPRGCLAPFAKPIKDAINIPVFVAGRIVEAKDAEDVLVSGSADFISLGRALYADPHWCLKAFGQMKSAIRQCIACNVCHDRLSGEIDVSCVQNPMMGTHFETLGFIEEAHKSSFLSKSNPKRILILGSGVSGLESARASAELGHIVEVWEEKTTLGGQISLAIAAPHKKEVENAWSYRFSEAKRLNVQIKEGVIFSSEKVKEFNPDLIIMATGAIPKISPVDLSKVQSSIKIHQAWEVLANPDLIKDSSQITVLGGGTVGIETADLLLEKGCKVSVIEYKKNLAEGLSKSNRREILDRLENASVQILTNAYIINVMSHDIELNIDNGSIQKVSIGDALIIAVGAQPQLNVLEEIQILGISHVVVGDANSPGDFMSCIRDAWMVGSCVDRYIDKII